MPVALLPDDPHDRALRERVRPAGWVNPMPAPRYQLVVAGGGPAGLVCAAAAAGLGAKVALVERDLLGGDCLTAGCVPSKTLLRAARAAAEVRRAADLGVRVPGEPAVDFPAVMERVRRVRAELSAVDAAARFRALGVDVFLGEGRFLDSDTVEVNGAKLRFGRCVVATGSRPAVTDVPGLRTSTGVDPSPAAGEGSDTKRNVARPVPRWFTNETVFTLTELPRRLLVIGAGPVGCELGQAFARLGSRVTLVAVGRVSNLPGQDGISPHEDGVLPKEEPDARRLLTEALRRDGVEIVTETSHAGFDAVLVAAGRVPNVDGLNLAAAGIAFDTAAGITVDDRLRTTNPRVFAAGDVCSLGYRFTHAADATARLAVRNALFPTRGRASALTIPWCTYTDPEVGRVGLSEADAAARGRAVDVYRQDFAHLDRAAADGEPGFVQVLTAKGTDRIVGATVVGPHAGELVGTVSLAMTHGLGLKKLAATVFPYPTYSEALRKIGDQFNRGRLTPRVKWLLGTWLRWFR